MTKGPQPWKKPVLLGIVCAALLDIPIYFYIRNSQRTAQARAALERASLPRQSPATEPASRGSRRVIIEKIVPGFQRSPEFVENGTHLKRMTYGQWFEIEVEFSVGLQAEEKFADELTIEYLVEIKDRLYSGAIIHEQIERGANECSILYMTPRELARVGDGVPLGIPAVKNVWIKIKSGGVLVAEKSLRAGPPSALPIIAGRLVPRSQTPFRDFWWDRYAPEKKATTRSR